MVEPAEQQTGGTRAAATSETAGAPEGGTLGSATAESGPERDPEEWVTGDEPMTGPQRSYLDSLARRAGEELPADLTKAQASEHIDRLQEKVDGTS
ncbi:DUF3072 domain-containing protein [Phycicoccus flavus]|uniref:DUF3072 domain-containing protein n=1 Tax=Phycicoccus flavus TaxID=2502783 RepID=UPI001F285F1D|nr:DUF3072 domain-containing protein [Phycicoccus flavus]